MANLKTKKTAAGAQQYSSKGGAVKLAKSVDKDIEKYLEGTMSGTEFKEKYGVSIERAQNIVYAASSAEKSAASDSQSSKDIYDRHEKGLKKRKTNDMSKGGMTKKMGYMKGGMTKKMGYNKGGYCGASMPAERPMKKGK